MVQLIIKNPHMGPEHQSFSLEAVLAWLQSGYGSIVRSASCCSHTENGTMAVCASSMSPPPPAACFPNSRSSSFWFAATAELIWDRILSKYITCTVRLAN